MNTTSLSTWDRAFILAPLVGLAAQWPCAFMLGLLVRDATPLAAATHITLLSSLFGLPVAYAAEGAAILIHRWLTHNTAHLVARTVLPIGSLVGAVTYLLVWEIFRDGTSLREVVALGAIGAAMGCSGAAAFLLVMRASVSGKAAA